MASESSRPAGKVTHRQAASLLAERDPVIANLVADAGLPRFPVPKETHFETLVRAITYQQLAGAAARAIHGRLIAALDGNVTAERLAALPDEALRAAGLSGAKTASLRDLSAKVLDGTVRLNPRQLSRRERRGGRGTPDRRAGHRQMDRRHVPDVPASAARHLAHRGPRRAPRLRPGLGHPDADGKGTRRFSASRSALTAALWRGTAGALLRSTEQPKWRCRSDQVRSFRLVTP